MSFWRHVKKHEKTWIARPGMGLFYESEQVVEEYHQKFAIFWDRYKVLDLESEMHGEHLLNCLIDFNTKNI